MSVAFTVYGKPEPAGSKRAFARGGRTMVVDANPSAKPWKQQVAWTAIDAMSGREILRGPLLVSMIFTRRRPVGHLRADGRVKDSAPEYPTTRPDVLKLARAVEDAMSGIVYTDDSQIVDEQLLKLYGGSECVEVRVEAI